MNGGGDTKWYVLWIAYCFLFLFSLNFFFNVSIRLKFCFCFFLIKFNYFFHVSVRQQTFIIIFTASVNNEINWKLEGTNRKTRKAYRLLFKVFLSFLFLKSSFFSISCYNKFELERVRVNHFHWVQTIHCTDKNRLKVECAKWLTLLM